MSRFIYTEEMLDWLADTFSKYDSKETTARFNARFGTDKTHKQICSTLKNHKIRGGNRKHRRPRYQFSEEQVTFLKEQYKVLEVAALTHQFNRVFGLAKTSNQIKCFLTQQGIKSGRTGRFEKGSVPANKGMKGRPVHPNSKKTQFKKGTVPPNVQPLGAERICSKDGYILVKVAETNPYTGAKTRYKHKQLVVWEQANGPVPEGFKVRFLDGDKTNCDLDNLALVSSALHAHLNRRGYNEVPEELKPALMALCQLEAAYFAKKKELSNANG